MKALYKFLSNTYCLELSPHVLSKGGLVLSVFFFFSQENIFSYLFSFFPLKSVCMK